MFKKPDASMTLNGSLAGLVGITAGCNNVTPMGAVILGGIAGVIVVLSVVFIDKVLKVDDPVGAVSVHGVCGAWGTLAAGLFNADGVTAKMVGVQALGVVTAFAWSFTTCFILFKVIKAVVGLRVSREEELEGLDMEEHGNLAYPDFQIHPARSFSAVPPSMPQAGLQAQTFRSMTQEEA
jgi:ammonium transporter, Amt family